jgi:O-methyltransferase involved in polyketide biosynthesis
VATARTSIGPTAHYTGAVWARRGLSHPALTTGTGKLLYWSTWPATVATRALGGTALEEFLYARHVLIDRLLEGAIERSEISQVIEIAAGMSPRGWRFAGRHGERLTYVETDLKGMAYRKRAALERAIPPGPGHTVEPLDALRDTGPESLAALAGRLDPGRGTAVVMEGLISYLDRDSLLGLWARTAEALARFPNGLMLADVHLAGQNRGLVTAIAVKALSAFVRGPVEMHFEDEREALAALAAAGFAEAELHSGAEASEEPGAASVHVLEARTRPAPG